MESVNLQTTSEAFAAESRWSPFNVTFPPEMGRTVGKTDAKDGQELRAVNQVLQ